MPHDTYYLETYGCTLNSSDSELIVGVLNAAGLHRVKDVEKANFIILNTCGVKTPTEQKILHQIKRYGGIEGKQLVIAGCLPLILKDKLDVLRQHAPNLSAIIGPKNYHEIPAVLEAIDRGTRGIVRIDGTSLEQKSRLEPRRLSEHVAILAIAEGCVGTCTYCCTRFARGVLDCYQSTDLAARFSKYIDGGTKEVFLTAEDCSAYFDAVENVTLPALITRFLEKPGHYFVRIGMMNPRTLIPVHKRLIETMWDPRVFKFIHVPIQSGSDRILKAMNRLYTVADVMEMIENFKSVIPGVTIDTDIICGFPGETDEDFLHTVELVKRLRPDVTNISMYGHRPGTAASQLKQVPSNIIKARTRELTTIHKDIAKQNHAEWIGWEGEAIIEEYNLVNKNWLARNVFYKPIVVERGKPGETVRVRITEAVSHYLVGKIIP